MLQTEGPTCLCSKQVHAGGSGWTHRTHCSRAARTWQQKTLKSPHTALHEHKGAKKAVIRILFERQLSLTVVSLAHSVQYNKSTRNTSVQEQSQPTKATNKRGPAVQA